MFRIRSFLSDDDAGTLDDLLEHGNFTDGRTTAGGAGQTVKKNVQLDSSDQNGPKANELVHQLLTKSEVFKAYAMPYKISNITFSRYTQGMHYGNHTDSALNWNPNHVIRSDLSFTIFLSSPDEYDGGELVVTLLGAEKSIKFDRGDMAIYPSGLTHRVNEVTGGCRRVAIGWLQSTIPQQERREIVHAIYGVRNEILSGQGRTDQFMQLDFAYSNLLRMWSRV